MMAHKHCPRYIKEYPGYKKAPQDFMRSFAADVSASIFDRTGLQLNDDQVLGAYYACQAYYSCNGPSPSYLPCALVADWIQHFARMEDVKNYHVNGPASRWATGEKNIAMWLGQPLIQKLQASLLTGNHIWCTHDVILFPLVTLLNLFELGPSPEVSNASWIMPMASRLILRRMANGRICVHYNGKLVRTMNVSVWRNEFVGGPTFEDVCSFAEL